MCRTAKSIQGIATNPSVMSTWLTWLNTGPAKAYVAAARRQATVESFRARRKTYIPTAIAENTMISVANHAARSGRTTKSPVRG